MYFLLRSAASARKVKKRRVFQAALSILKTKKPRVPRGEGKRTMNNDRMNSDLYLGMGLGLAVGVVSTLLMRPRKKDVKSAVARVIGDMADSVSKNMGW